MTGFSVSLQISSASQLDDILNEIFDDGDYSEIHNNSSCKLNPKQDACPSFSQKLATLRNALLQHNCSDINIISMTYRCQEIYLNVTTQTDGLSTLINKRLINKYI